MKFDPAQFPIIQLSLSGEEEPEALRKLADELNLELAKIEGVASVNLSGTAIKEVRVELDQDKLRDFKLSQADVVDVIESNNISMPKNSRFQHFKWS
ncbi:RND efflux system, inner membrane transporter [Bacillus sp. ZZV12-4809]|nr:RND efflux system, inner membrane transporter [Bacillus sp. ZZV12-4809]